MKRNYHDLDSGRDVPSGKKITRNFWLAGTLLLLLLIGQSAIAQVANYTFAQTAPAYTPLPLSAAQTSFTTTFDDDKVSFNLPFTFNFNGVGYTTATVSSNGFLVFGSTLNANAGGSAYTSTSNNNGAYMNSTATGNGIAAFNADLIAQNFATFTGTRTSGSVTVTGVTNFTNLQVGLRLQGTGIVNGTTIAGINTTAGTVTLSVAATASGTSALTPISSILGIISGTAPNQTLVFQYTGLRRYNLAGDNISFQIRLNQGNNVALNQSISISYNATTTVATSTQVQVGIRSTTSDYKNRTSATSWSATTAGTANTNAVAFSSSALPPAGLMFTFTPPQPVAVPNCASGFSPATAATNVGRNATLSWTAATGGPTGYDVYLDTSSTPTTLVSSNQAGLSYTPSALLAANTTFYWRVEPRNANGPATGCTTQSFTTGTGFAYCTPTYASGPGGSTVDGITNVTLGTLNNSTSGATVSPYYTFYSAATVPDIAKSTTISVSVSFGADTANNSAVWIDFNQNGTFETTEGFLATNATMNGTSVYSIPVPADAVLGQTRMRVRGGDDDPLTTAQACGASNDADGESEDYIVNITPVPSCMPVTNLAVSAFSGNSATITWTASTGSPVSYQYEFRASGAAGSGNTGLAASGTVPHPTATASTNALAPNTTYIAYIRAFCGGTDYSSWSAATAFTTPCASVTVLPSTEGFEGTTVPCWTVTPISGTGSWSLYPSIDTEVPGPHSGLSFAGIAWESSVATNSVLSSSPYDLSANGNTQARLKVWIYRGASGLTTNRITIKVNTVPGAGGTQLLDIPRNITQSPTVATAGWYEYTANIPVSFNSGVFYINAQGVVGSSGTDYSIGLDDFRIEFNPPTITGFTPATICANGTDSQRTVTITGANFVGATNVSVNGTAAQSFTVNSATQITAVVSASATSGTVSVTGPGGTATSAATLAVYNNYPFYADSDGDTFGAGTLVSVCSVNGATPPPGYSLSSTDCDDSNNAIYQSATLFIDTDNDGYTNGTAIVCYGATIPAGYKTTSLGSDCNDNDNTVYQSATLYTDADGDGYNVGSQTVCYGAAVPTGLSLTTNGTDCDDTNGGIYQTGTFFADADNDNYDNGSVSVCYGAITPVGYKTTTLGPDCNDNDNSVYQSATLFVDADNDGYTSGVEQVVCYGAAMPSGYVASLTAIDCNDAVGAIHPNATEVPYNAIDDDCDGTIDETGTVTTTLTAASCGTTLASIGSIVGIETVAGHPITGYRVRIKNGAEVQTLETSAPHFRINQFQSYAYATTYTVDIMLQRAGVWQASYGAPCFVSTPAILEEGGAGSINPSQCGITLAKINTLIATTSLAGVTGYRFRITNLTDAFGPNAVQTIERTQNWFSLQMLTRYNYGTLYRIEVAVKTTGTYGGFGTPCEVSSPLVPSLLNCGGSTALKTTAIASNSVAGATQYRFQVVRQSDNASSTIDRTPNWFNFNMVPAATYTVGALYTVRVAVMTAGTWSPFGDACEITAPSGTGKGIAPTTVATASADFKAAAFPNPFTSDFNIDVTTSSQESVQLKVYDMLGKLVESREVKASDLNVEKVGAQYPSGVYNVIVSQDGIVKTLRVIKR